LVLKSIFVVKEKLNIIYHFQLSNISVLYFHGFSVQTCWTFNVF
jgi:hypothetical protein